MANSCSNADEEHLASPASQRRKRKRVAVVGAAITTAILIGVGLLALRGRTSYRTPLGHLDLTEDQARQVEDWVEAHPCEGYYPDANAIPLKSELMTNTSQDAFLRAVLTPQQWAKYSPYSGTPGQCINPGCPVHGRINKPHRIAAYLERHLPVGWTGQTDSFSSGHSVLLRARHADGAPSFDLYVVAPGRNPPKAAQSDEFAEIMPISIVPSPRCRAFARLPIRPESEAAIRRLLRRALLSDMLAPGGGAQVV